MDHSQTIGTTVLTLGRHRSLSAGADEPYDVVWYRCDRCRTKTRVRSERAYLAQLRAHRALHAKEDR